MYNLTRLSYNELVFLNSNNLPSVVATLRVVGTKFLAVFLLKMEIEFFIQHERFLPGKYL